MIKFEIMTLRSKTLISIGITLTCLLIVLYSISSTIFLDGFIQLERDSVANNAQNILNILNDDLSALSSAVGDWAAWDDTYRFIKDANQLYVKKNLPDATYSELKLNLILFVNSSGEIIFGRGFDLLQKKGLPLPRELKEHISIDSIFLKHDSVDSSVQGILLLPDGPMLVAARPILTSERKGPILGSMIFGRYLNNEEIKRWSEISKLSIKMHLIDDFQISSYLKENKFIPERDAIFVKPIDSTTISGYFVVKDIYKKPALLFRLDMPRTIYQQGKLTLNRFVLLLGGSGLIFGVMLLFFVEKSVLARLARLSSDVRDISAKGDHSLRINVDGRDELANIGEDINEMLKSLERSHSFINAVIEDLPEGIILVNSEYRVVLANKIGLQHLKFLSNAGMGDVLSHIGSTSIIEMVSNFSRPPHIIRQSINVENFFFEVTAKYIGIGKNKDIGIVFVFMDVTKEKTELMERIQSRENLSAVGQLAAGIAHDFNNILTGITGYAELLYIDLTLPDKVRRQLKVILQNAERATNLVRQILDFSRKSMSEFEVVDLKIFFKDFIDFLKRIIPENIRISFDYKPGDYRVMADRTKLQQVLMNMSLNAKDAMPMGGELVFGLSQINVNREVKILDYGNNKIPEGDWVALTIRDSGTGIPKNVLPRIFEPFYTTKEVGKGTGLGLSQVYGIIKQHDGYINVYSKPDLGTTFTFYLPVVYEKPKAIYEDNKGLSKGVGGTILIIEDDQIVLEFVSSILIDLGYTVLTAQSSKDALNIFESNKNDINLVITDMVMPGIDGITLVKMLKEINPSAKVIVMSGYPIGLENNLKDIGITACLQKPMKIQALSEAVSYALNG